MPHMHDRFERFFTPQLLLGLNAAIIVTAETVGGGRLWYDTGFVYVLVPAFMLLVAARICGRYRLYDSVLRRFLGWSLAALAVLFLAYGIAFADQNLGHGWPTSAVYGVVVCLHLAAVLCVAVGAFHVLKARGRMRFASFWLALVALVGAVSFAASLAAYLGVIPVVPPRLYVLLAAAAGVATGVPAMAIATVVPALRDFAERLAAALTFLIVAAGAQAVRLVAAGEYAVHQQATYVASFALFAALSFLFLAFGKFVSVPGAKAASPARVPSRTRKIAAAS